MTGKPHTYLFPFFLLLVLLVLGSCSTSGPATTQSPKAPPSPEAEKEKKSTTEEDFSISNYHNTLRDVYSSKKHEVPEEFLTYRQKETTEEKNIRDGYRIQLISTRNVAEADSVSLAYTNWIDSLDIAYKPKSYIVFRQPYFRVRVGDFSNRQRAIEHSRWIKRQFPDAWVVHDIINPTQRPEAVLARQDTTETPSPADSLDNKRN